MRYPAAYYLLLLYSTVLMRCAMPVAFDAVSHIFSEEKHIATIHAVYGNNHVEKEVAAAEKANGKSEAGSKNEEQVSIHLSTEFYSFLLIVKRLNLSFSSFILSRIANVHLRQPLPPPKCF